MLILSLAPHADARTAEWAFARMEGGQLVHQGRASAAQLAQENRSAVAIVPAQRLSWHGVTLPPNSHGSRLPRVLQGLLEDVLLEDPASLHLVPAPNAQAIARTGGALWVAVCDPSWLRAALAPLQAVGIRLQGLLPELSPGPHAVYLMGSEPEPQVWWTHPEGVVALPAQPHDWRAFGVSGDTPLYAEASHLRWAQAHGLEPEMQNAPSRWLAATRTGWDLARGEWGQGQAARLQRALSGAWDRFAHAPQWRWTRWGLLTLLAMQWLGLEWQAWQARAEQAQWQVQQQALLQQTFPKVQVVLDPPLQMAREVQTLRLSRGQLGPGDFEPLLAALGEALDPQERPQALHYQGDRLRVEGVALSPGLQARLQARGYSTQTQEGTRWHLQPGVRP
ncbi:MAG: general secretion pathway protein GspL [Limnohabitans sp.]|nr:general secretion pathway protein GspL [Limnohabitans sp.]